MSSRCGAHPFNSVITHNQQINVAVQECANSILRRTYNWLRVIERRVQNHRNISQLLKFGDQRVKTWISLFIYYLDPGGTVYVENRWNNVCLMAMYRTCVKHVAISRRRPANHKPLGTAFRQDAGSKRTE